MIIQVTSANQLLCNLGETKKCCKIPTSSDQPSMFVLMCGWEEKWGSCSPPGSVMKFALFCDHQRDAKCDTFWELRSFLSPQGNGLGGTDKETDESWDIFIIWKINSGLVWAAGPVLWKKSLGPIMSNFWGPFFFMFSWAKNKSKFIFCPGKHKKTVLKSCS